MSTLTTNPILVSSGPGMSVAARHRTTSDDRPNPVVGMRFTDFRESYPRVFRKDQL